MKIPDCTWELWDGELPLRSVIDQTEIAGNVIFLHYQFEDFKESFSGWDHYFFEVTSDGWQVGGWNEPGLYDLGSIWINSDKRGLRITSDNPKVVEILQEKPEVSSWHEGCVVPDDLVEEMGIPLFGPNKGLKNKWRLCKNIRAETGERFPLDQELEDWISDSLESVGITKERWEQMTRDYERQERIDEKYGVRQRSRGKLTERERFCKWLRRSIQKSPQEQKLRDALGIMKTCEQQIYACDAKERCVGIGELPESILTDLGLQTCQNCDQFERV